MALNAGCRVTFIAAVLVLAILSIVPILTEHRYKYQQATAADHRATTGANDTTILEDYTEDEIFRKKLDTPTGWWPTDTWLADCAHRESNQVNLSHASLPQTKAGWLAYRLGDCIKVCKGCGETRYPSSLSAEYSKRACPKGDNPNYVLFGNTTIIDQVLELRNGVPGFIKPTDDEIIIHLRLGDVIENSDDTLYTMLTIGGVPYHSIFRQQGLRAIKSSYELLTNIHESGASMVSIIGGFHTTKLGNDKSRPYAECIRQSIEKAGYPVNYQINANTPDQDFYQMSHAKHIVVSTGGYSRLVGENAERKGGTIHGTIFPLS